MLACFSADATANLAATRALLLLIRQVVDDLDTRQVIRQLPSPMLVMIDAAGGELLAALGLDDILIHWNLLGHGQAEEQEFCWTESLGARPVEPTEDGVHLRLVALLHRFDPLGGFLLDSHDHLLEQDRVIRKFIDSIRHGRGCTTSRRRA